MLIQITQCRSQISESQTKGLFIDALTCRWYNKEPHHSRPEYNAEENIDKRGNRRAVTERCRVSLREIITACVRLGVDVLSAYAFSTENWNRPQHEVNVLMHLFAKTFIDELPLLKRENVRVVFLGDISALPKKTRDVFERGLAECANHTGMTLALAVNYGARAEITRAVRQIALDAAAGKIDPGAIDDDMVASHLYTAGLPDPELVIRTSGELRLSNYLLWQVAYSEFYVTDTYWPDFDRWGLVDAILAYQGRDRRFGGLSKTEEA